MPVGIKTRQKSTFRGHSDAQIAVEKVVKLPGKPLQF
jgi:hypothetical protein